MTAAEIATPVPTLSSFVASFTDTKMDSIRIMAHVNFI